MLGLSLIHFGFLAAAAAVSVPILIHLLLRPRARPQPIGSLRFLKQVLKESTQRRKVRRLLLLALRALAVLLLSLLFARPYLTSSGEPSPESEVLVLVDQSATMRAVQSGSTLFAAAQDEAARILKRLPEGTAARLAYFDDRGVVLAPEAAIDPNHQPGYAGTDYGQALTWARDVLALSPRPHRKVFLLTDLQRTGLRRTPCAGFPENVPVEVVAVGQPLSGNVAVEKVDIPEPTAGGTQPLVVTAQVLNAGVFSARNIPVTLSLKGDGLKPVEQRQTVTIAAGSYERVRFAVPPGQSGLYAGYVEAAADDEFPTDNRRWLAFQVRRPDRLLLVDGQPGSTVFLNETYYLEAAIRLAIPDKGPPLTPYDTERLPLTDGASLPDLRPYSAVVLCNIDAISEADVARLQRFVTAGRSLLVFTGDNVQPQAYDALGRAGLFPATVEGVGDTGPYFLQTWNEKHPIFTPFADPQHGDLRRISFRRITRLSMKPEDGAKILAAAQSREPLLVEKQSGNGRVLVFASTADRKWSDWPQSRLYVPIVHQMIAYLTGRLPENGRLRLEPAGSADQPPGISTSEGNVVVRNLDPAVSQIQRCSEKQFRTEFHLGEADATAEQKQASMAIPPGTERPDEMWTQIVWILLGVLVVEVFVANRTHA